MKNIKHTFSLIGLVAICALLIYSAQSTSATKDEQKNKFITSEKPNDYNIYALDIPMDLNFAGERVPLNNPDIFERMDRELLVNTYWQSNGLLLFKRAHKYFPIIEPILKANNIPDDFKYLAVIESGLQNVVSPAKATGFWQILSKTGREFGLEVNSNVDERYHLEKATEAACEYLKNAKNKFGSWTLSAAAYNAGISGINKRLKSQNVDEYYDLLLGQETGRYVFRILAVKEILSNPKKYGFNFEDKHLYNLVPTYELEVDTAVTSFTTFAEKFDINYKILKLHNPWLREPHLNNKSRKLYKIKIPKEGYYK